MKRVSIDCFDASMHTCFVHLVQRTKTTNTGASVGVVALGVRVVSGILVMASLQRVAVVVEWSKIRSRVDLPNRTQFATACK